MDLSLGFTDRSLRASDDLSLGATDALDFPSGSNIVSLWATSVADLSLAATDDFDLSDVVSDFPDRMDVSWSLLAASVEDS